MNRFFARLLPTLLLATTLGGWAGSLQATLMLPLSLQQMTSRAQMIFQGRVLAVDVRLDEVSQRVATFTTFEVLDTLKGTPGARHTIKQMGGHLPGSHYAVRIHGIPEFTPGQEYIVFLAEPSRLGFSSPIGLSQGAFRIDRQADRATVRNVPPARLPRAARSLRPAVPEAKAPAAARVATPATPSLTLSSFKSTVRSMVSP